MTAAPAPELRTLRWRGVILALIAFGVFSTYPLLGFHAPVQEWQVLLITLLATCAVIGWMQGGSPLTAIVWLLAAGVVFFGTGAAGGDSFFWLER
ncbi:MAG TPA: hypothetical protein VMY38_09625, partial [Gemmatimonadaceae bacterium]|nr:hypothetical protein [Gemmatimonadaceae bacterium]